MKLKHGKGIIIAILGCSLVFSTGVAASSVTEDRINNLETKYEEQLTEQKKVSEEYKKQLLEIDNIVEKTSKTEVSLDATKKDIKDVTQKIKILDRTNEKLIKQNKKLLNEVKTLKKELH